MRSLTQRPFEGRFATNISLGFVKPKLPTQTEKEPETGPEAHEAPLATPPPEPEPQLQEVPVEKPLRRYPQTTREQPPEMVFQTPLPPPQKAPRKAKKRGVDPLLVIQGMANIALACGALYKTLR